MTHLYVAFANFKCLSCHCVSLLVRTCRRTCQYRQEEARHADVGTSNKSRTMYTTKRVPAGSLPPASLPEASTMDVLALLHIAPAAVDYQNATANCQLNYRHLICALHNPSISPKLHGMYLPCNHASLCNILRPPLNICPFMRQPQARPHGTSTHMYRPHVSAVYEMCNAVFRLWQTVAAISY